MKNPVFAITLSLVLVALSYGQAASPTPTPSEGDVVKISTTLIQIDVTVTDKKGKVITDLRPDEIEVYENGKKQDVSHFSFISNVRETSERPKADKGAPLPVLPPSAVKAEQVRRTIALVVDDLTLSFESTYFVRRALKKFVDEQMQDGDLVAIIRTGAGIGALQQFTTDRRQLYAAIENVKWNSIGAGGIGAFAPLQARMDAGDDEDEPQAGERTPEGIEREFNDFRTSIFATGTLGAINYVVRGMAELPGRKSVLLLSDGFRLFTRDAVGNIESTRMLESLRRLVDQANRASVVVYTMDARGLEVTGLTAADDTSGWTPAQIEQAMRDRSEQLVETQDGLRYLARQTGGISIINSNDLVGGIRRILDDQSYYLVGYEPDTDTFDPKTRRFNRLDVRVTRPGARVRYRSGFFGVSDEKIRKPIETGNQKLLNALTSPFAANEIDLRLNALFGSSPQGPFVRSFLHIPANDLTFTDEPNGSKKAVFDVMAFGFGNNGVIVDQISKTFTATLSKDLLAKALENGLVYNFTFPMKKSGAVQLRVAVRDHGNDKVGSANQFVDVPNLKKKRLTLSGVVLENIPYATWQKRSQGHTDEYRSNPVGDTAQRRFKQGTVMNYGLTIFNAKAPVGQAGLVSQIKLFLDGKAVFEGSPRPVVPASDSEPGAINLTGTLSLATKMTPGEYVLQIAITDPLAKEKYRTAYQFVQFEVVE
ncbi:MAG: VWA domain-containing protein [Acidobacteria bacterium]|nr:VWA domain-containing protein [Acidobacteriota bacterium]